MFYAINTICIEFRINEISNDFVAEMKLFLWVKDWVKICMTGHLESQGAVASF